MPPRLKVLIAAAAILCVASPAVAAPPAGFDRRAETLLRASGTPGMSVTIVEAGRTTLEKGYGLRRSGSPETVDARTIFPVASVSKAFTSAALAILVDQGKLGWDDRVIDHLPDFRMQDPWVTRELTVRDLLVHRSGLGLGAGDLLFWPRTTRSRAEIVARVRHLPPATSFRSGYAYDNVLYIVAGQLIEAVSGKSWETFVADEILTPAGMSDAAATPAVRFRNPNRAGPHARLGGAVRGLGDVEALDERDVFSESAAPAGGLTASAHDMGRWISIQLARGALPDAHGRLFSAAASEQMWTPQTLMPREANAPKGATPLFSTYALGWKVIDYKSRRVVWHSGGIMGFRSIVVLVPEENVGFSVLTNAEDTGLIMGLMYELLDHYVDPKGTRNDWPKAWAELRAAKSKVVAARVDRSAADVARSALGPAAYVGEYVDPWYGPMSVSERNGRLWIDMRQTPGMSGELTPWSRDSFQTRWSDRSFEPAFVSFAFTPEGTVDRVRMRAVSPQADFSYDYQDLDFAPVRDQPR
jgi:CubicO group peptidase (beta-lactamase class C family)